MPEKDNVASVCFRIVYKTLRGRFDRMQVTVTEHYPVPVIFEKYLRGIFTEKHIVIAADGADGFMKERPPQVLNIFGNIAEETERITASIGAVFLCESEKIRYFKTPPPNIVSKL